MMDGVSLDQIRTFIAAADAGSFSAAGRRLGRAQSVVSQTMANLEAQLGVTLFDRSRRSPVLTAIGQALLADARVAVDGVDQFKARARGLAGGLEAELSIVVDVLFPIDVLTSAVSALRDAFPGMPLRLYVEALGAVIAPVLDGRCTLAVVGSLPILPPGLSREALLSVEMGMFAAPTHPLGRLSGPVPLETLAQHVQLVLTDRTAMTQGREFGVFSAQTWRLADLGAKHAFLRSGLGWGSLPLGVAAADVARGALVELVIAEAPTHGYRLPMSALYPADKPPGPAGRWLIERLKGSR
jgi:DNA-binding transcriptional LysR family regulator